MKYAYILVFFSMFLLAYCTGPISKSKDANESKSLSENQADKPTPKNVKPSAPSQSNAELLNQEEQKELVIEEKPVFEKTVESKSSIKAVADTKVKTTPKVKAKKGPKIEFEEMVYDFGEIVAGDIIKHKFNFRNTGDQELIIHSASASCGCTDPSYPFLGVAPGESGFIGVAYNSVSKEGHQKPEVLIKTNASKQAMLLFLEGEVTPRPKEEKKPKEFTKKDTSGVRTK